jgi:hypothetical protein
VNVIVKDSDAMITQRNFFKKISPDYQNTTVTTTMFTAARQLHKANKKELVVGETKTSIYLACYNTSETKPDQIFVIKSMCCQGM